MLVFIVELSAAIALFVYRGKVRLLKLTNMNALRGSAKKKEKIQKSEITMEVGGWVQVSFGIFFCGKSCQNGPKPVLVFWSTIPCVFYLYMHC